MTTVNPILGVVYQGDQDAQAWRATGYPSLPFVEGVEVSDVVYAGAKPIGTAVYTVPTTNVRFVSPSGTDTTGGTLGSPYRTVQYAISNSPSGTTIVIRAGVYHEKLSVPSGKTITLQNYPNEAVWFDGTSAVSGWTDNGNGTWTADYAVTWDRTLNGADLVRFKGSATRNLVDQVWLNEIPLTQIADNTTPAAGQFSVNQSTHKLTIGSSPTGKSVRASDLDVWLVASGQTNLYGIGIRRFSPQQLEFLYVMAYYGGSSQGSTIENCFFQETAMACLSINRNDFMVRSNTFQDSEYAGINAYKANNLVFTKNIIRRMNRSLWQGEPATSGIKIVGGLTDNITISFNHITDCPICPGIWFDTSLTRVNVICNYVNGDGIQPMSSLCQLEGMDGGKYAGVQYYSVIAGNVLVNGSGTGLHMLDAGWTRIYNNDLRYNSVCLNVHQDPRKNPGGASNGDPAVTPWLSIHHTITNNIFATTKGFKLQFIAYDDGLKIYLGGDMFDRLEGNWFAPAGTGLGSMVQLGTLGGNRVGFNSPALLAGAGTNVGGPLTAKLGTNYQGTTAPANTVAAPLPADIANLMGVDPGLQVVGPVLSRLPVPLTEA